MQASCINFFRHVESFEKEITDSQIFQIYETQTNFQALSLIDYFYS